jgi:hypothetical protein
VTKAVLAEDVVYLAAGSSAIRAISKYIITEDVVVYLQ